MFSHENKLYTAQSFSFGTQFDDTSRTRSEVTYIIRSNSKHYGLAIALDWMIGHIFDGSREEKLDFLRINF